MTKVQRLTAGKLLRTLEEVRVAYPDNFDNMPVYLSMVEEGEIDREGAHIESDSDATFVADIAAVGRAYHVQLHYAPSLNRKFIVLEGEDDDFYGDQPDEWYGVASQIATTA